MRWEMSYDEGCQLKMRTLSNPLKECTQHCSTVRKENLVKAYSMRSQARTVPMHQLWR